MVNIEIIAKIQDVLLSYNLVNQKIFKPLGFKTDYQLILLEAANESLDKYNLFLSAFWIDDRDTRSLLLEFFEFFKLNASSEVNAVINAIFFVHTSDQTVQYFSTIHNYNNQNMVFINSLKVVDNLIENAFLLNPKKIEKEYA